MGRGYFMNRNGCELDGGVADLLISLMGLDVDGGVVGGLVHYYEGS